MLLSILLLPFLGSNAAGMFLPTASLVREAKDEIFLDPRLCRLFPTGPAQDSTCMKRTSFYLEPETFVSQEELDAY
jgi:hypothetical protein